MSHGYYDTKTTSIHIGHPKATTFDYCCVDCNGISQEAIEATDKNPEENHFYLTVEDNGRGGDGCCVSVMHTNQKESVASFLVPDKEILILAEILGSIGRLRQIQD